MLLSSSLLLLLLLLLLSVRLHHIVGALLTNTGVRTRFGAHPGT